MSELQKARAELASLQAQHEAIRFRVLWEKLYLLAARAGDAELMEEISWFLLKFKNYYLAEQINSRKRAAAARKARPPKIKDADYDRLVGAAKNDKHLAALIGVNPVSLSRYKARRFGTKS